MGRLGTSTSSSSKSAGRISSPSADLSTIAGLEQVATQYGFGPQAQEIISPTPKLSFLQRLSKGLGAFNPAEAILTGSEQGTAAGVKKYFQGIGQGIGSAVTGKDLEGERRFFSDVAERLGVENGILRFGIGFLGDVLLDPTTYVGGAIARGLAKTAAFTASKGLSTAGRFAPKFEQGVRLATEGIKDAFGRAFRFGYKASEGAADDVLTFMSKQARDRLSIAEDNLNRLGTGVLTKTQRQNLSINLIKGKRAEFAARETIEANPLITEARKYKSAEEFINSQQKGVLYHGSPTGQFGDRAVHVGTKKAAQEALEARIGIPANGKGWTGETAYGDTLLAGQKTLKKLDPEGFNQTGFNVEVPVDDFYPRDYPEIAKNAVFGDGAPIPLTAKPKIFPVKIKGEMTNLPTSSLSDTKANATIAGQLKKGTAKRGYYYENIGEDAGSISAVVPSKSHLELQPTKSQLTDIWKSAQKTPEQIGREAALSGMTPEVRQIAQEQIERSKAFARDAGIENPYESYFPFIKNDKVEKFLFETRGLRVGSEGYRKQFKNLLTNGEIELDPAKAFFTRESQIVADTNTREFLNQFIKHYGVPLESFESTDDAARAGFHLLKEKGLYGKEIGYVTKYDYALLRDSLAPEFQSINMLAKATGFDAVTSLFKRSVTGLFLPFHVRNYVSGIIQNYESVGRAALNPETISVGQKIAYLMGAGKALPKDIIKVGGKARRFDEVMQPFVERFSGDTFYSNDFLDALKKGDELKTAKKVFSKSTAKETVKTLGLGTNSTPFRIGRAIGQFIEHQQKAVAYVAALGQGKSIRQALKIAENAGFDYRALTRFESQIMRRLVPFYSFTRKNIELQLRTLRDNPQRINQVFRFFQNLGEPVSAEEKNALPDYIKESLGIKLEDTEGGLKQYISSFGTPIEAFAQLFGTNPVLRSISQMNPILKVPIEIGTGRDSFRQRDLKEVYDAREYKLAPQIVKDMLEIKEVKKDVLTKTATGELIKTGERIQYVADPVKLLIARSLFTSRGVTYLDQLFGGDILGFAKFLKTTTGLKPQQIDIEQLQSIKEYRIKRELEDVLTRYNVVRRFQTTYLPKQ